MSDISRDLAQIRKLAALQAHANSPSIEDISNIPLARDAIRSYAIPLVCQRTGIVVGQFTTINVAGHMPLLGQWRDTQVLHPLFSLAHGALLQFSRNCYLRFCGLSPEETNDPAVIAKQEQMLQIATLCMLHHLTEVRQDVPWIPAFKDVVTNWTSLMAISYWKANLDSQRFRFPSIRLSKLEKQIDLSSYLKLCWQRKQEYEKNVSDKAEEARLHAAERALVAIRDDIAGKKPLSPRILWRWFEQTLSKRYEKDLNTWMWELFTATEKTIKEFTLKDCELFEEIFVSECPTGSSISHAFLEVIRSKRAMLQQHYSSFEILIPKVMQEDVNSAALAPEPKLADFASRTLWFIAHSKWKLAQPRAQQLRQAQLDRQQTATVKPSFIPTSSYLQSVIDEATEATEGEDDDSEY